MNPEKALLAVDLATLGHLFFWSIKSDQLLTVVFNAQAQMLQLRSRFKKSYDTQNSSW